MNAASRPHLIGVLAGLFLAAALVFSAMTVTRAWLKIAESQTISVTGSARKVVRSDLVVWRCSFSAEGDSLLAAQRELKADLAKVIGFLQTGQLTNYLIGPIAIHELQATHEIKATAAGGAGITRQTTVGFRLTQMVEVRAADVERIAKLDQDSTVLVEQGVMFAPAVPEYIYTQAGEAKVEMLAEATRDARARAEQIAAQGGRVIAGLRSARMGVFQITPVHSLQTSSEGMNDTTSLEKTLTAVVSASFSMK